MDCKAYFVSRCKRLEFMQTDRLHNSTRRPADIVNLFENAQKRATEKGKHNLKTIPTRRMEEKYHSDFTMDSYLFALICSLEQSENAKRIGRKLRSRIEKQCKFKILNSSLSR